MMALPNGPSDIDYSDKGYDNAVAVIGMALRLPGVTTPEAFWDMIVGQRSGLRDFTEGELRNSGVSEADRQHPDYVAKGGILEDIDQFDPAFFGFSPREARLLPPQNRLLFECCWEAMERAAIAPIATGGHACGIFMGQSQDSYWQNIVARSVDEADSELSFMSNPDYLATSIAHKFDLRGPAMTVQSFCSTSLLAVHMARQAILEGQCETALAGGTSVRVPQAMGYTASPQTIYSPDGVVRSFDKDANGTLFGNGVGVVLLKRLDLALADQDPIQAILRGSAANNDGNRKVSYNAPSVQGQSRAVAKALREAHVAPHTVGYVECHGTATALGDPVEVAALTQAFQSDQPSEAGCALGTAKTHVGHVDRAAGIIGLIKATLTLQNRQIPQLLNYQSPNPRLDLENSPFYIPQTTLPWEKSANHPRRCGVNALGYGGTNVHAVLEEAPVFPTLTRSVGQNVLLPVSARSAKGLVDSIAKLAEWMERTPNVDLIRLSETLCIGRAQLEFRRAIVCGDVQQTIIDLRRPFEADKIDPAVQFDLRRLNMPMVTEAFPHVQSEAGAQLPVLTDPLEAIAYCWVRGAEVDFGALFDTGPLPRYCLPPTAFDRQSYWVEADQGLTPVLDAAPLTPAEGPARSQLGYGQWIPKSLAAPNGQPLTRIVYCPDAKIGAGVVSSVQNAGDPCLQLVDGATVANVSDGVYTVDPTSLTQIAQVLDRLKLWGPESLVLVLPRTAENALAVRDFIARWINAIDATWPQKAFQLDVVATGIAQVGGDDPISCDHGMIPTLLRSAMVEFPNLTARALCLGGVMRPERIAGLGQIIQSDRPNLIALRGRNQWQQRAQVFDDQDLGHAKCVMDTVRKNGTYVITGGLGGIGSAVAERLMQVYDAHVVLIVRDPTQIGQKLERLHTLQHLERGSVTCIAVDLQSTDADKVLRREMAQLDAVHGVFHTAGIVGDTRLTGDTPDLSKQIFAPKITGLHAVMDAVADRNIDFAVLFSSMAAVFPSLGQADYAAANAYLDSYAQRPDHGFPIISINWNSWRDQGAMADAWARPIDETSVASHPLLQSKKRFGDGRYVFALVEDGSWLCTDHLVLGQAVLSGTTLAEVILTAFRDVTEKAGRIDTLVFAQMLPVADLAGSVLVLHPEPAGSWFVEVTSSGGQVHALGRVSFDATDVPVALDLSGLKFATIGAAENDDGSLALTGRWLCNLEIVEDAAIPTARVSLQPDYVDDCASHMLHPALLDIASSALAALTGDADLVPVAYTNLRCFAPLPEAVIVTAAPQGAGPDGASTQKVMLYGTSGAVLASFEGLSFAEPSMAAEVVLSIIDAEQLVPPIAENPFEADSVSLGEGIDLLFNAPIGLQAQIYVSRQFGAAPRPTALLPDAEDARDTAVPQDVEIKPFIRSLWATFLGAAPLDDTENFLKSGGNSLVATRFIARIKDTLGVAISLKDFFENPTVIGLAALIDPQLATEPSVPDDDQWEMGTL